MKAEGRRVLRVPYGTVEDYKAMAELEGIGEIQEMAEGEISEEYIYTEQVSVEEAEDWPAYFAKAKKWKDKVDVLAEFLGLQGG